MKIISWITNQSCTKNCQQKKTSNGIVEKHQNWALHRSGSSLKKMTFSSFNNKTKKKRLEEKLRCVNSTIIKKVTMKNPKLSRVLIYSNTIWHHFEQFFLQETESQKKCNFLKDFAVLASIANANNICVSYILREKTVPKKQQVLKWSIEAN